MILCYYIFMLLPIKNLFSIVKKRFKPFLEKEEIFQVWYETAGFGKPIFFRNKELVIQVSNSAIAQELQYRSFEIIKKINTKLGSKAVRRLRFRVC
ncbi:MAG: DUF721 domain-containing protein [bacterium]